MTGIYMVSAQKPTAVTHSILGRITSPNDLNLVICKSSLIEIYKVSAEGLRFIKQFSIWGIVENLNLVKIKNEKKESILITTSKYDIIILTCELQQDSCYDIVTKSCGNIRDTIPRNSSTHMITRVDSSKNLIAIKCYDGILKTLNINSENKQLCLSTVRMNDLNVIDLVFLKNVQDISVIAIICKEPNNKLLIKAYELNQNTKELINTLWKKDLNESQAFLISVPEPYGGLIIVGSQAISYYNATQNYSILKSPAFLSKGEISSYAIIDQNGQRYLLSNTMGDLFLMVLVCDDSIGLSKISDIRFELLGEISIADNITYIDNGVVFIGSKMGDSQLIKLIDVPNENDTYINVLETYTNLGPILDMLVVDIEKQGQGQLITCSGGHKNGSLRIIRSGIGIQESANIELPGVKSIWPLKITTKEYDDHLVLNYYGYSKIFSFFGEEFEDVDINGFDLNSQTLFCSNVANDQVIQITSTSIRLLSVKVNDDVNFESNLEYEWKLSENELLSVATANFNKCLVASRNKLIYFEIGNKKLVEKKSVIFDYEIACLDLISSDSNHELCAIGLWGDISARLLTLPNLEEVCNEYLKGDVIPRSILIEYLEKILYLFVSLGDGSVISYVVNKNYELVDRRKVVLGTQPTILKKITFSFNSFKTINVFACSDRPSVISSANQKLVYSSVNLKQVENICQLNAKSYPNSLALLSGGTLRIGIMDSLQKLHIRTVQLNETSRRICYQPESQAFGLITYRVDYITPSNELKSLKQSASTLCSNQMISKPGLLQPLVNESQATTSKHFSSNDFSNGQYDTCVINSFLILDQNTFEVLQSVQFQIGEYALSVISIQFENDLNPYFVVGCGYVNNDDPEPKQGRLIVFKYSENKLVHICEKEIRGGPYCIANFNGKLLVSVSNQLKLYEFKENQLNQIASYSDNVFIIHLKCKNDFILIGDMMKSCSILTYRYETNQFEPVAKDHTPVWLSSIEIFDDDTFLMGDCFQNIISLKKDSGQSNEEDRKCLQNYGCMHLGEQINIFRHGSLVMQQDSNDLIVNHHIHGSVIAGTVSGSIILFSQLSTTLFKILNELQQRLSKYLITAGKLKYERWRDFESERRIESYKNFIDGDLIESYLELTNSEAENLIKDFKIDNLITGHNNEEFSVMYFNKLIEELTRLH